MEPKYKNMELREFILLYVRDFRWFIAITILFTVLFYAVSFAQSETFITTLGMNVGRSKVSEVVENGNYSYGEFYRLQADERFADTLVRWLGSPRVVLDIYKEAELTTLETSQHALSRQFSARRLSSQYIEVRYSTQTPEVSQKIARAMESVLNSRTAALNSIDNGTQHDWFLVLIDDPVVEKKIVPPVKTNVIGLALGMFIAFWVVLIRHYLREEEIA